MTEVYHATQLPLFILQKQCNKCPENGLQDINNFPKDRHSKDGFYLTCKECLKKYYQANKEHKKAQVEAYRQAYKEQYQIYSQRYREKNQEKVRDTGRRYRKANREKELERHRIDYQTNIARHKNYIAQNRERIRQQVHVNYLRNREKKIEYVTSYQRQNIEHIRQYKRAYHLINRDKRIASRQKRRARLRAGGSFTAREWRVLRARYHHTCLCCGKAEPDIKLTPDHVIPLVHGGRNAIDNIQPLCLLCNLKKGTKTIDYRK
jgi:hypothetical protein